MTTSTRRTPAVYVFRHGPNGWVQEAKILPPNSPAFQFGISVDVWDDTLVVGEPEPQQLRAHVFRRSAQGAWTLEAALVPPVEDLAYDFGESVAIYQDRVLVGASQLTLVGGGAVGAVYPFSRIGSTWTAGMRIDNPTSTWASHFGFAIDLYGEYAVIGAYGENYGGNGQQGSAYIYQLNSAGEWGADPTQTLASSDASEHDFFGRSVSIYQDRVAVGAPGEDLAGTGDVGAIYGFTLQSGVWTEVGSLEPEEPEPKRVGESVALETWVVSGAIYDDEVVGGSLKIDVGSGYVQEFWE